MPPKLPDKVIGQILQLSYQEWSASVIRRNLLSQEISVSVSAINGVIRRHAKDPGKKSFAEPEPKRQHFRPKRTYNVINNVKHLVQLEDPVSQEEIARRVGVSQPTVSRMIDEDLCLKRLKKPEIKRLSDAMITKRKKELKAFIS